MIAGMHGWLGRNAGGLAPGRWALLALGLVLATLNVQRATVGAPGSRRWRRAWVSGAVGFVALVVLAVGGAAAVVLPSRAGAEGLPSNAFSPGRTTPVREPCEVYGRGRFHARYLNPFFGETLVKQWVDRVPTWRGDGREIVFADGNAVYAASGHGTQLWRPAREDTAVFHVDGRWRYVLEGIVSFDGSGVGGALVYATCWAHQPDGSEPEIAGRRVRLAYPSGDVDFDIGDDLYEITVVRPAEGTATRLSLGNLPTWSPDGRRLAFVSAYWPTDGGAARLHRQSRVQIMAADGTDLRSVLLPAGRPAEFPPRWSPDGTRLALLVTEETQGEAMFAIYTVGADGTGLERLAEARSNPAWSPDGRRLAFVQPDRDRDLHLYTMAADGTDVQQITAAPVGSLRSVFRWVTALAWSPDGSRILVGCFDQVCVAGLDGQLVGELPLPHFVSLVPAWSADGRRIALYNATDADRDKVVLASSAPDGSDWRVLVRERAGEELVADQAENFLFPGPVATRAACRAGVVVPTPAQHPGLVALRAELFGQAATNWTTNTPLAAWEGVVVGGAPPRVRALVLGDGAIGRFDHGGRLPAGIAELAFLERLELSKNGLTGSIPAAWGALARLRWLDLSGNKLSGTIPPELGRIGSLEWLHFNNNQLTGPIPAALGELGNLEELGLADNQLTGAIPPELGRLRNLEGLALADNQLTGAIPAALGQLPSLRGLALNNNQLTGAIPAALGQLRSLEVMALNNNQLTGGIPAELAQLRRLEGLWLANNQLTGAIPAELGHLRRLELAGNQFTGCIPVGLKRVRENDLEEIYLLDCEAEAGT